MESLLANVSLATPLSAWLSGTGILKVQQLTLARASSALSGYFSHTGQSNSPQFALPTGPGRKAWDKVPR